MKKNIRTLSSKKAESIKRHSDNLQKITVSDEIILDIQNIVSDVFYPLTGFMNKENYKNVVYKMKLVDGHPWTLPVILDVPLNTYKNVILDEEIVLQNKNNENIALMKINGKFKLKIKGLYKTIFDTDDMKHPGVKYFENLNDYALGGEIFLFNKIRRPFDVSLLPYETKILFKKMGWKTITGFQTRNVIHRAHEYLQRIAMEVTDGVFLQPLVGWKKKGDFLPHAVLDSYKTIISKYYPKNKAVLGTLTTYMRYAGPREAVFHAIIRRNFGCTHFIVGRDHAGVGTYYDKYAAHRIFDKIDDPGIIPLKLKGPFYCKKCASITTDNTCGHNEKDRKQISGTYIRNKIKNDQMPDEKYIRPEVSKIMQKYYKKNNLFHDK